VHPTQLYEAVFLAGLAWLLIRWRREGLSDRTVLGRYFLFAGLFRFALEFLRVNTRVLGPFTVAHLFAVCVVALGAAILARPGVQRQPQAERA
jgi:prolipoprotein diacylglyceryltransferase